jgi:hypothetical protein
VDGHTLRSDAEAAAARYYREQLLAARTDDTAFTEAFHVALGWEWPDGIAFRTLPTSRTTT